MTNDPAAPQSPPEPLPERRVQQRGLERQRAILEAALEEFSSKGSRGTIASVAHRAGITDAGLLYHFPSKEDLLLAVVKHHDELGTGVLGFADDAPPLEPIDAIRSLGSWGDWMERDPNLMSLHVQISAENIGSDSPAGRYFHQRYAGVVAAVTGVFERAQASGALVTRIDPAHEARVFVALLDGLRLQWFFTDGVTPIGATVRGYLDALLARIAPGAP